MNRFFKFLAVTVDVLLIIDIASDLCRKWREKMKILKIVRKKSGRLKATKSETIINED